MQTVQPSLFARDDTFFGVCQGIGEDFGINPLILRLAFTAALFFYPFEAVIGYVAAGAVVLATRLIFPVPRPAVLGTAGSSPAARSSAVPLAAAKADEEAGRALESLAA